jgi:23S rRNA (adenine2503-C2)-methyltransferase
MAKLHLLDMTPTDLEAWCRDRGLEGYRGGQLLEWVYRHRAESFEAMTNLPKRLRGDLDGQLAIYQSQVTARRQAEDGTDKLLLTWADGATTECVLIPERHRQTACVSTQVGCPVGCAFCASGLAGFERNLTAGQIVEQAMRLRAGAEEGLSHVVLMGIGEPLLNYEAVLSAIRTLNAPWGLGIGARRITLSTVGVPKQIRRLAGEGLQINLALSLHAPTDTLRRELVPMAQTVSIAEIVEAARDCFDQTGREVTLEYVLLGGVNDRQTHAERLVAIARQIRCNVNLIRYNPVAGLPFGAPEPDAVTAFAGVLRRGGVNVQIRASRGGDIEAACGQLRLARAAQQAAEKREDPSA